MAELRVLVFGWNGWEDSFANLCRDMRHARQQRLHLAGVLADRGIDRCLLAEAVADPKALEPSLLQFLKNRVGERIRRRREGGDRWGHGDRIKRGWTRSMLALARTAIWPV
ncbi:hypothetical protein DB354_11255 [Opitutus sp. ER46]|nr:hypothetical protein DB354_11255 [Opitutus sp. ER46]